MRGAVFGVEDGFSRGVNKNISYSLRISFEIF